MKSSKALVSPNASPTTNLMTARTVMTAFDGTKTICQRRVTSNGHYMTRTTRIDGATAEVTVIPWEKREDREMGESVNDFARRKAGQMRKALASGVVDGSCLLHGC